jgi:hypothetical protein
MRARSKYSVSVRMEETAEAIPSISSGVVGSRFVTENEIDLAKARREEQWKAAYARLGQEPPPQPKEEVYDGRSLAEVSSSPSSPFRRNQSKMY